MTPYEQAERWHGRLGSDWTFAQVIEAHLSVGHVVSTPEVLVMARRIGRHWCCAAHEDCVRRPWVTDAGGNCWHVWLIAGDWRRAWGYLPHPLPWVSFHRRGRLHVLPYEAARRLLCGNGKPQ